MLQFLRRLFSREWSAGVWVLKTTKRPLADVLKDSRYMVPGHFPDLAQQQLSVNEMNAKFMEEMAKRTAAKPAPPQLPSISDIARMSFGGPAGAERMKETLRAVGAMPGPTPSPPTAPAPSAAPLTPELISLMVRLYPLGKGPGGLGGTTFEWSRRPVLSPSEHASLLRGLESCKYETEAGKWENLISTSFTDHTQAQRPGASSPAESGS